MNPSPEYPVSDSPDPSSITEEASTSASPNGKQLSRAALRMVMINIIAPIVIYAVAVLYLSVIVSLILSGLPPLLESLYHVIRERQIDLIAVNMVLSIVISVVVVVVTSDPRLLLVKDSINTVLLGILFGASVLFKQNLIWRYNVQWNSHNPKELERLNTIWETKPAVRRVTNIMSLVYGVSFCIEAGIRVVLIYTIPLNIMVYVSPLLLLLCFALVGLWSYFFVRWARAKNQSQSAEAQPLDPGLK
ncbi:uncharacterized protein BJ171DRAFT_625859 [Polychytrium aggregatum]|uniref:uncharacterized protein n=1 Tax=Polychytrium aggregatum TaxID=110093 RepID=UPI0022FE6A90|nr:uncharacterized protein BJ171DRAFT_625859 [Polychytrium aggregatum]KAI9202819.1 hypothetical protein BJ171DRAFT_625859 [Polychytrium aggregatum]